MKACGRDENDVIASSSEFIKGDLFHRVSLSCYVVICCVADNDFNLQPLLLNPDLAPSIDLY